MRSLSAGSHSLRVRPLALALLALTSALSSARADDWPQWLGPKRDGVWRETGILQKFPPGGPKIRWRAPVGQGYSGPAVAGGRVYLTDYLLAPGARAGDPFSQDAVAGKERVLCLDEPTGKLLWKYEYDVTYEISYPAGPRTTPVVAGGKVYTLGVMGDLLCLDAARGTVLWSKNFPKDFGARVPMWGFSASPLLDGDRLICLVGGQDHVAVAFHKDTGKVLWHALSALQPGYAPPVIYPIGGKRQLIIWHPEAVNALDPETGKVYWSQPFGNARDRGRRVVKAGLTIPTPRFDPKRNLLFVTAFYDGPLMLKLNGTDRPTVLWKGSGRGERPEQTTGLHSIMPTPFLVGGYIYGVCSYGELRCLNEETGERIWETYKATVGKSLRWGNAFLVKQGDRFILFNELGDLIIAKLSPQGYDEISRANILEPTNRMAAPKGRRVIWSHPAYANRSVYARNDRELVCVSMAAD
jgi:outer membrane protein assembly factor BamB